VHRDPLIVNDSEGRKFKTSIVFSLGEGPGQLFKALAVFALRDLDLLKIESRPLRSNPLLLSIDETGGSQRFNYLFYVDFVGKLSEVKVQNAMRHLQEIAPYTRVLGSFPMDENLGGTDVETMFAALKTSVDE
jgi:arogenate/prephenate dehydratase